MYTLMKINDSEGKLHLYDLLIDGINKEDIPAKAINNIYVLYNKKYANYDLTNKLIDEFKRDIKTIINNHINKKIKLNSITISAIHNTNLLIETLDILLKNNKTENDVLWCGSINNYFSWEEFKKVAMHTNYDRGFGFGQIANNLIIVGTDFWLERHNYDTSEWWEFKSIPIKPLMHMTLKKLSSCNFDNKSLEELNNIKNKEE